MGVPYSSTVSSRQGAAVDTSPTGSGRSTALTLVAIYFLGSSALGAIAVLALVASGGQNGAGLLFGLLFAVPFIYGDYLVGRRLLDRDERGRGLGMFLTGLGLLSGLYWVSKGAGGIFVILLLLNLFVLGFLWTTKELTRL